MVIIKIRHFIAGSLKTMTSYHMLIIPAVYSVYIYKCFDTCINGCNICKKDLQETLYNKGEIPRPKPVLLICA